MTSSAARTLELDIIAMRLQKCEFWRVVVAFRGLEQTRIRLTKLLQSPLRTRIEGTGITPIEKVMH